MEDKRTYAGSCLRPFCPVKRGTHFSAVRKEDLIIFSAVLLFLSDLPT
jgi:hypothetical protein